MIARASSKGALIRFLRSEADAGVIEALDDRGQPMPELKSYSGLAAGGYIVFFDLPAGRYVLKGASFAARGVRYRLLVPEGDLAKRAAVLRPASAAYLGTYHYDSRWPDLETALKRCARIVGHWLTPWTRRPVLPRDGDFRFFDSSPVSEIDGLHAVRGALSGTSWRRAVDARLRELGAAEPAKTTGTLLPKPLPLHAEAMLSWRDTLEWGQPRRAAQGLAWRRPGGAAQIAVYYTTVAPSGLPGWEGAVAGLRRAAAASVEDSGEVFEVRVATRSGPSARTTTYQYPEATLVGSRTIVVQTETTLIPDGSGFYTFRLRAPREEFSEVLPAYREFLLQIVLGPQKPTKEKEREYLMPGLSTP